MLLSMPHIAILLVLASFLPLKESLKLFGMPRFLPKASTPVASSVAGQDLSKVSVPVRTLGSIGLPQPRELQSITDRDFNEQVLETNGLAIVLFTRYTAIKNLIGERKIIITHNTLTTFTFIYAAHGADRAEVCKKILKIFGQFTHNTPSFALSTRTITLIQRPNFK